VNIRKTVVKVKSCTFLTAIITFAAGDGLNAWVYDINATSNRRGKGGIRLPKFFIFQLNKNNRSDIKI
jgi:hypothetical protein